MEDIPKRYDAMITTRYPDALRKFAGKKGINPWKNDIFKLTTKGPTSPARMELIVHSNNPRVPSNLEKSKGKYRANRHGEKGKEKIKTKSDTSELNFDSDYVDISITISSTVEWALAGSPELAKPQLRFHLFPSEETLVNIREKRMAETAAVRKLAADKLRKLKKNQTTVVHKDDDSTSSSASREVQSRVDVEDALVGSVKSEVSDSAQNVLMGGGGLVLSEEPTISLNTVPEFVESKKQEMHQEEPRAVSQNLGQIPDSIFMPFQRRGINDKRSVFQAPMDFFLFTHSVNRLPSNELIAAETFEYKIRSARHWQSHSFKLLPGKYFIIADVESENIEKVRIGLNLDRSGEIAERPWLHTGEIEEDDQRIRNGTKKIYVQLTSTGNFDARPVAEDVCSRTFSTAAEVVSLKAHVKMIRRTVDDIESQLYLKRKEFDTIVATKDARKRAAMKETFDSLSTEIPELEMELEINETRLKNMRLELFRTKWMWSDVKEDVWPLMAETQSEVASRGLVDMAHHLRLEAAGIRAVIKSSHPENRSKRPSASSSKLSFANNA